MFELMPQTIFLVLVAYVVGMFPTARLVGRRFGVDPTRQGSGNPGAANICRLLNLKTGVVVGAIDLLKGVIPTALALVVADRTTAHLVWIAVVLGHVWPAYCVRKGGKGVATASGAGLALNPIIGLLCAAIFLVIVKVLRVAALGSLAISVGYPVLALAFGLPASEVVMAVVVGVIVVVRHQSNIRQLLAKHGRKQTT